MVLIKVTNCSIQLGLILARATDFDGDFSYVQWEAVLSMNTEMLLFVENWSNLTGLLTHMFPTAKCIFHLCCLLNFRFDR